MQRKMQNKQALAFITNQHLRQYWLKILRNYSRFESRLLTRFTIQSQSQLMQLLKLVNELS